MEGKELEITPEEEQLLRCQRHDFINHIQVLHGYLQLGKNDKAKDYLDRLIEQINAGDFCAGAVSVKAKK